MTVLALGGSPLLQSGAEAGTTVRPIGGDGVIVASPNLRFGGSWGGGGQGGSTSGLLEAVILVRLYQFFFVWMTLRGLPPRRA